MTMKKLKAMPKIHRICKGEYEVKPLWAVSKDDDRGDWMVIRFVSETSDEVDELYRFSTYAEARDHALMEANIIWLGEVWPK